MSSTRTIAGTVGDTFTLKTDYGRGSSALRIGEEVRIVGFSHIAYGRVNNHGLKPGIYENPMYPIVQGPHGEPTMVGVHDLASSHDGVARVVQREALRVGDLPDSAFHEMDEVFLPSGWRAVVQNVEYMSLVSSKFENPKAFHCQLPSGVITDCSASELVLAARGPVWRRENGEDLQFDTPAEAGAFHRAVGEYEELKNPASDNFAWTRDAAVEALLNGEADGFHTDEAPRKGATHFLIKFHDEQVGEAVRLDTLEKLGIEPVAPKM